MPLEVEHVGEVLKVDKETEVPEGRSEVPEDDLQIPADDLQITVVGGEVPKTP